MTTSYQFNPFTGNFDLVTTSLSIPSEVTGPQVTKQLYVDGNRTDTYVEDGDVLRPFKTVMGAINQVVANADNATFAYTILIAVATYNENITLNNAALYNLSLVGQDYRTGVQTSIGTGSGYALDSSTSNTNLGTLGISNLSFNGDMRFQGGTNGSGIFSNQMLMYNCNFLTITNGLVLNNVNTALFFNCNWTQVGGAGTTITNCEFTLFGNTNSDLPSPVAVVTNGGNQPSQFGGQTFACFQNAVVTMDATVDAGSFLQIRSGSRFGSPGGSLSISGLCQVYNSFIRSDITVNLGGTLNMRGAEWSTSATVTNNGTITNDGVIYYTAATPADWNTVPLSIKSAVDDLAASRVRDSVAQNLVLASPNGSAGLPTFRALLSGDLPASNAITALTGDVTATGPGSVAATIANLAVTNAKIANATIDLTAKVTGVLPEANGGTHQSTYTTGDILYASAANTLSKLAAGTNGYVLTQAAGVPSWAPGGVSTPNYQISSSSGTFSSGSGSYVDVTNLAVTLTTTGRPVVLTLVADGDTTNGNNGQVQALQSSGHTAEIVIAFVEGSTIISQQTSTESDTGNLDIAQYIPSSSFSHFYVPAAGTYTWKVRAKVNTGSAVGVLYTKLVAYEI